MMSLKKNVSVLSAAGLLLALPAVESEGALVLKLENGASVVTVFDNGLDDSNPVLGTVEYVGTVGVFDINTTVGVSKPSTGSAFDPKLNLNSLNASSTSAGTLTVRLTDTDFLAPTGAVSAELDFGGNTDGTASLAGYLDSSNTEFGTGIPAGALGPFGSGVFSDSASTPVVVGSPYSASLVAVIDHAAPLDFTSFSAELSVVPEPGSLALVALGGVALASRRRRHA